MMKEAIEELREYKNHHCPHCKECFPTKINKCDSSIMYGKRDCSNGCGAAQMRYQKSDNQNKTRPFLIYSKDNDAIPDPILIHLPSFFFCGVFVLKFCSLP